MLLFKTAVESYFLSIIKKITIMTIFIILLNLILISKVLQQSSIKETEPYYHFPHFWTNVGFCPAGLINHEDISKSLLSDALQMNLRQIGALPKGSITHIRIHWLLELIEFLSYTQAGIPIYDFRELDVFLDNLREYDLLPVIEYMGNPGNIFTKNPNQSYILWEHLVHTLLQHFINSYGYNYVATWRFESWNEPDIKNYNLLHWSFAEYLKYIIALRTGLKNFKLIGPAGLFKSESKHPLCWKLLQYCAHNLTQCPLETLTFHSKGKGQAEEVLENSSTLLKSIYQRFPNLQRLPIANE